MGLEPEEAKESTIRTKKPRVTSNMDEVLHQRLIESNKEIIQVHGHTLSLSEYLATHKILQSTHNSNTSFAFFKLVRGHLQLHVGITSGDTKLWYRFHILDATVHEVERNTQLNIR